MSRHPPVKWAQRSDSLYITIELPDAQDVKLKLEPEGKFYFSATTGAEKILYEVDIDLYDKVDVNESKASVGSRSICYLVKKAENKWWSRLLKQGGKAPVFLKVDWDKWVDEDEEPDNKVGADMDFGDFDFSKLNMGGGQGMGDFAAGGQGLGDFAAGGQGLGDFAAGKDDDYETESDTEEEITEQASAGHDSGTKATGGGEPSGAPDAKA